MGKKARLKAATTAARAKPAVTGEVPAVGGREPCPCGSGRRYKACHGRAAIDRATAFVARPFEGLAGECDWIALREFVPAATATLRLAGKNRGRTVTLATVLPAAVPAISRADGEVLVALSTQAGTGDPSRSIAAAIEAGLAAEPDQPVEVDESATDGARLQDLLDPDAPPEVTVHDGFEFWLTGNADPGEWAGLLEQANTAAHPTKRLSSAPAAYWCEMGDRHYLRWVLPHRENPLLDALARLHAAGHSDLGDGSRLLGTFRASGLLVPVWDLPVDRAADHFEGPLAEIDKRLTEALATDAPLTSAERRARDGLRTRQLTIR